MEFSSQRKCFDLGLLYLRRVHAYDYFSGTEFPNERLLSLKLGLSFLRIEADYQELPDLPTIFKKMLETAEARMQVEKVDNSQILKEEI